MAKEIFFNTWNIVARMAILDAECEEDLKRCLCGEEKSFSEENVSEKDTVKI